MYLLNNVAQQPSLVQVLSFCLLISFMILLLLVGRFCKYLNTREWERKTIYELHSWLAREPIEGSKQVGDVTQQRFLLERNQPRFRPGLLFILIILFGCFVDICNNFSIKEDVESRLKEMEKKKKKGTTTNSNALTSSIIRKSSTLSLCRPVYLSLGSFLKLVHNNLKAKPSSCSSANLANF